MTQQITQEQLLAQLEALKAENETLKAKKVKALSLKVSQKGAVSLYGMGRFPVTLYKEQWERVISNVDMIKQFLVDNASNLSSKE